MNLKKRNPAADILRIIAFFFMVSVHFFLNTGFYDQTVDGKKMLVLVMIRSLFIVCVPMFMMLSGYLLRKKQVSGQYYKKSTSIILTYVLASLACIVYSSIRFNTPITAPTFWGLLEFNAAPYAWYIEMYLGLFLLIPFINLMYNNLPSQKWKLGLVLTFVALTALPSIINIYAWSTIDWWLSPSTVSVLGHKIIPAWWEKLYPITYYFIGCYLSEYGLKMKKLLNAILIVVTVVLSGLFCFWRSRYITFVWGPWCAYESLFNVILTTLIFAFFTNMNYDKMPGWIAWCLKKISGLCLGAYLVSWIFDNLLYPELIERVPVFTDRIVYFFVVVPLVFAFSLALSYVLSKIQWAIEKLCSLIGSLFTRKKNNIENV